MLCNKSVISQQIKHIWLSACRLLLAAHLHLFMCCRCIRIILPMKVTEWSYKGPVSSFLYTDSYLHLTVRLQLSHINLIPHKLHLYGNWSPSKFNIIVPVFSFLQPRSLIISQAKTQLSNVLWELSVHVKLLPKVKLPYFWECPQHPSAVPVNCVRLQLQVISSVKAALSISLSSPNRGY